jgi:1,4-dihydroxy-2-naphthoate polyprenyltransferase
VVKNILINLRIPFSLLLLPVFLLAVSQTGDIDKTNAYLVFFILHFLVYPSSNGFNSLMDDDKGSIGMIEKPEKVASQMLYVTLIMDIISLFITFYIFRIEVFVLLVLYILASRAYSYRNIRLKKYPFIGFLTVVIFQGPAIYFLTKYAISEAVSFGLGDVLLSIVSLLLVGAGYPISQIYQHEQDKADGVETISMVLGINGTFTFSLIMFSLLNILLAIYFVFIRLDLISFILFFIITAPVGIFFMTWMKKTRSNPENANFKNTMRLNLLGAMCNNLFLIVLIVKQHLF